MWFRWYDLREFPRVLLLNLWMIEIHIFHCQCQSKIKEMFVSISFQVWKQLCQSFSTIQQPHFTSFWLYGLLINMMPFAVLHQSPSDTGWGKCFVFVYIVMKIGYSSAKRYSANEDLGSYGSWIWSETTIIGTSDSRPEISAMKISPTSM